MDFAFVRLYQHQLEKIADSKHPEVVFVGDSSLGNAIDVDEFELLSGMRTENLALTGAYGYSGTLNMIRRVLQQNSPDLFVIMQSPDMLTRSVAYDGYLHTALSPNDWRDVPLSVLVKTFANLDGITSMARTLVRQSGAPDNALLDNDYIRQGPPISRQRRKDFQVTASGINPKKAMFLERIAATCEDYQLKCVYAIGPWFEEFCKQSKTFIKETKAVVRDKGLPVVGGTPKCLPPDELGDSWDHVAPHAKAATTGFYYRSLLPFLVKTATTSRAKLQTTR